MLTKKSKIVSVSASEVSVSPEVTKPRARAKVTTKTKAAVVETVAKPAAIVRHTRVSVRKPIKAAEPVIQFAPVVTDLVTGSEIANRAYHIWLENGCPEGTEVENWTRAECELRMAASA